MRRNPRKGEMERNIVLDTDSYKLSHHGMYPSGTTEVYSYFESRSGAKWPYTVFFGLQYLIDEHLHGEVVTGEKIEEAERFSRDHFGNGDIFNKKGWLHILNEHGGRLPVEIKAVPEGSFVPESNVLLTIRNTDPECPWLTNHLETLLVQLWYPCTVATSSAYQRYSLESHAERTASDTPMMGLKLHDFGFRGSTSHESAALGGAAHLVVFEGTDNIAAVRLLQRHYGAKMPGISIPAAEHSTITAHGKEVDAYRQIIRKYPMASVVSDSYDYDNALRNIWGGELKQEVLDGMEKGNLLVIRPDSGDPVESVVGTLNTLSSIFGHSVNPEGFKSLPQGLAVIQGDGISPESLDRILDGMYLDGWTLDSVVFGSGGGLLQQVNRDTQRFAMKCSSVTVDGVERGVSKNPATDTTKRSKRGKLRLLRHVGTRITYSTETVSEYHKVEALETVFTDGWFRRERTSLAEIREKFRYEKVAV